jgi:carotenoid cleavage dioxygenase-like enzyme
MKMERLPPVKTSLGPSNHPYLNGAWTPLHEEVDATELDVIEGAIPHDIDGIYLRNTENQLHQPLGRYHPFDGDGMVHQIDFRGRHRRPIATASSAPAASRPSRRRAGRCGAG